MAHIYYFTMKMYCTCNRKSNCTYHENLCKNTIINYFGPCKFIRKNKVIFCVPSQIIFEHTMANFMNLPWRIMRLFHKFPFTFHFLMKWVFGNSGFVMTSNNLFKNLQYFLKNNCPLIFHLTITFFGHCHDYLVVTLVCNGFSLYVFKYSLANTFHISEKGVLEDELPDTPNPSQEFAHWDVCVVGFQSYTVSILLWHVSL